MSYNEVRCVAAYGILAAFPESNHPVKV